MKITPLPVLLATLLSSVCSAATPPAAETPAAPPASAATSPAPLIETRWNDIKDLGYDDRATVLAILDRVGKKLDLQITALEARRAKLTTKDDPVKFNDALKVLDTARTRLTSYIADLRNATPENWTQRRDRIEDAWVKIEDAYKKALAEAP